MTPTNCFDFILFFIILCGVIFAVGGSQNLFETGNFRESRGRKWEECVAKEVKQVLLVSICMTSCCVL